MAGKSKYDEFFAVIVKDDTIYKCPHPACDFTYIRTKGKSPGDLRTHLRVKHPEDFARLESKERADKENRPAAGEGGEKPKKKKKSADGQVRVKAEPLPPLPQAPPPPHSPPASAFHTPRGGLNATGGAGGRPASKRTISPMSSTPLPDFFTASLGHEVRAFAHYVGQRMDALPLPKRRRVELKVVMMLNEEEEAAEAPAALSTSAPLQPLASTSAAPPPLFDEPPAADAAESKPPLQPSALGNALMNVD
ncbi:hypothetical protein M3Y99_00691600 [Aphelenchoides fujianensis]|nr:hypothetical protein M3Y99_00691600 [Aphelenchoides fujianensis]